MKISVIIPVHNGGDDLRRCLEALAASNRLPNELIVVDDVSTDGSGDLARRHSAQLVRLDGLPRIPAFARNRGAEIAQSRHPEIAAVFGSYDDAPPAHGLASMRRLALCRV